MSTTGLRATRAHRLVAGDSSDAGAPEHADVEVGAAFWSLPVEAVFARLGSSSHGLTEAEAAERRRRFGANRMHARSESSTWRLLARQFANPLVLMLVVAALVSWLVGERSESLIILGIVGLSSALGFWQEQSASTAVRALLRLVALRTTVRRDGRDREIAVEELVPGDVVRLSAGSIVPADLRVVEARNLYVNEASLTGENFPSEKQNEPAAADVPIARRWSALFSGTHVISGTGTALVVATGADTEFGHIADRLRMRAPTPEFERGLQQFGTMLVKVTATMLVAIFAMTMALHHPLLQGLMFALAIAVGMTPELLPAIVSVTLAQGAKRMAQKRVIVKRLPAIENFGSMNVLCADKTGTLTEGTLRLVGCYSPDGHESEDVLALAALNAALQAGLPSPIDDRIREAYRLTQAFVKLDEVPYDFSRKRVSVLTQGTGGRRRLVTKGALAKVLEICTHSRKDGQVVPLSAVRGDVDHLFAQWSDQGLRVLGVAERDIGPNRARVDKTDEAQMTFAGFVAFSDVPKPHVAAAIERLTRLGIRLKIVTGDNPKVAAAVARQVGIAEPRLLTGSEMQHLSPEALTAKAAATDVFAEIEPNQKERIILALKRAGNVVGFVGDGINDAPALHTADVGISVDGAVDVAKEAAEIVLLDHELDVLAEGVSQGRQTFLNTLKYVYITSSANFGNMLSMAVGLLFMPFLPLLPHQILLNNFLSDLPAMTIGGDLVDREAADRPRRWHLHSIRDFMIVFGSISSVFDLATFAALLFACGAGADEFRSAWFIVSLLTEIVILLIMRTRRPFLRSAPSKLLLGVSALTAFACIALVYVPATAAALGFVALPRKPLMAAILITLAYAIVSERAKLWFFSHARYDDSFQVT